MTTLAAVLDLDGRPFERGLNSAMGLARSAAGVFTRTFRAGVIGAAALTTAVGVGAVNAFQQFETRLASVNTLLTDAAEGTLENLKEGILALPPALGDAASLTEGLYQAISAGTAPAQAIDRVTQSAKLARAGLGDLGVTTKALSGFINAYGEDSVDAATASDLLFTTVQRGVFELPQLAQQLGRISTTASAAGVSQVELTAALANITKTGLPARQAVSGLSAALSNIIKPSESAQKLAAQLGIDFSTAAIESKGLAEVLQEVTDATGGNVDALAQFFGSVEGVNAVLGLTKNNLAGFREDLDAFGDAATKNGEITQTAFEKQADTFAAQIATIRNTINRILIDIGEPLVRELRQVTDAILANINDIRPVVLGFAELAIDAFGVTFRAGSDVFRALKEAAAGDFDAMGMSAMDAAETIANSFAQAFPNAQRNLDILFDAVIFSFDELVAKTKVGASAVEIAFLTSARNAVQGLEGARQVVAEIVDILVTDFVDVGKQYTFQLQALLQTTADFGTAASDVFFELAKSANQSLGGIGDVAIQGVSDAISGLGTLANDLGNSLLQSSVPGLSAVGQQLRLLSVDITTTSTGIEDALGTVQKRNELLVDSQVAVNKSIQDLVPNAAEIENAYDIMAEASGRLAEPSALAGSAIDSITQGIKDSVEEAKAAQAELDAIQGGLQFAGDSDFVGLDLSLPNGGGRAARRAQEDEQVTNAAKEGLENLRQTTKAGTDAVGNIEDDFYEKRRNAASTFFTSLTQIAGNRSRTLFRISKAANIATATGNAFAAYNEALKNPPGPPFTVPIAVAALAGGLAQVASIKNQQLPAFRQGGFSSGGLALVGESGAEVVELPAGARVRPNGVSDSILRNGSLQIGEFNFNGASISNQADAEQQASRLLDALTTQLQRGENPEFVDAIMEARR